MRKIHSASTEEENENEIMGEDTGSNDKNVGSSNTMCRIEMQFLRAEYADVFSDYNEMSVQVSTRRSRRLMRVQGSFSLYCRCLVSCGVLH